MELQPPAQRDARAFFWRASALDRLENWPDAVADYAAWMQLRPGAIDSYALERIGDAQLASAQLDAALSSYSAAAESGRNAASRAAPARKVRRNPAGCWRVWQKLWRNTRLF